MREIMKDIGGDGTSGVSQIEVITSSREMDPDLYQEFLQF
jgi:alpha-amylase